MVVTRWQKALGVTLSGHEGWEEHSLPLSFFTGQLVTIVGRKSSLAIEKLFECMHLSAWSATGA